MKEEEVPVPIAAGVQTQQESDGGDGSPVEAPNRSPQRVDSIPNGATNVPFSQSNIVPDDEG